MGLIHCAKNLELFDKNVNKQERTKEKAHKWVQSLPLSVRTMHVSHVKTTSRLHCGWQCTRYPNSMCTSRGAAAAAKFAMLKNRKKICIQILLS